MKYRIVLIVILASIGFFNPYGILSDQLQKLIFYLSVLGATFYAMFEGISLKCIKYPRTAFIVLLASIVFSGIMASAFHMQSLMVSFMTLLPYLLAYFFFYTLMKLDVEPEKIMHSYIVLCLISMLVYFANVLTFPNNIFGAHILGEDTSRGIIRIPVVFIEFFPMIVFYGINKWLDTKEPKWLWLIGLGVLMIILSVIRQIIALTFVLGLFFFFKKLSWKFKILLATTAVAIVMFVLPMIPMYQTMIELSEQQKEENEDVENIRITAWRYYIYENQTNAITPIFGNGVPALGKSRWGEMFDSETQENGCFAVDVGWAGFYWQFGAIATIALLTLIIKAIVKPKDHTQEYINYWLIFLLFTGFASGPQLYYWQIIDITICLYFVYRKPSNYSEISEGENQEDKISIPRLPYYPQLNFRRRN